MRSAAASAWPVVEGARACALVDLIPLIGLIGLIGLIAGAASSCGGGSGAVLSQLMEARRISGELRVEFSHAADAANRSVMADTDEMSTAAAREAEAATAAVQGSAVQLQKLLQDLGYADEIRLLGDFDRQFAEYRALDADILKLAVENTNLKAQRLAFGPAQRAADEFSNSLGTIVRAKGSDASCCVEALVEKAVSSLREIQVLQSRHIAEPDEALMTPMESQMAAAESSARAALADLTRRLPASRTQLAASLEALDRFLHLNTDLLALSRRNSNVRSLALSLGRKRTLTAACDDDLKAIQDTLSQRGFNATR